MNDNDDLMSPGRAMAQLALISDALPLISKVLARAFDEIASDPVEQIAPRFKALGDALDAFQKAKTSLNELHDRVSRDIIPEAMRRQGIRNVTIEGVGRVQLGSRTSVKMLDKEAGYAWLRNNGAESLIVPTVNAMSLSAFCKSRLEEEGKDVPEDIFETKQMTYTSLVKTK